MPTRYLEIVAPKTRVGIWAWSPVVVLRVALASTYLMYVYAAIIGFISGVPVLDLTTPSGYLPIWSTILGVSALVSAVGSLTDRWQQVEKWASLGVSAMMLAYFGGLNLMGWIENDLNRQFVGTIAIIASILPITRFVYLAAQTGKRKLINVPLGTD
jgi:hypothetical protein